MSDFFTGGPAFRRSFRLFEGLGYDTDIIFARRRDGAIEEITVSHADYDGINGFTHMLESHDLLVPDYFPAVPERKRGFLPFTLLKRFFQYFRILWQFSLKSREWKHGKSKVTGFVTAWKFLTAEETARLRARAREAGVSLNSYLFYHLNGAIADRLLPSKHPAAWIVPVSLYPTAESAKGPGLRTSIMEVNLQDEDSLGNVHAKVRHEVESENYWGPIVAVLINHFLPDAVNRKILAATVASKKRVGTFSNLGRWKGKEVGEVWSVVPPVHPGQPLGVGAIELNGRLGVGFKIDPCLGIDRAEADTILEQWLREAK